MIIHNIQICIDIDRSWLDMYHIYIYICLDDFAIEDFVCLAMMGHGPTKIRCQTFVGCVAAAVQPQAARLAVTMNETMVRFLNLLRLATWNDDAIVSHRHLSMKGVQPVKMWILPTKL